jgi:hypothetical protein
MVAGAVLSTVTAGGCSFLFSEGAPADDRPRPFLSCGDSYAPPVIDTVVAGLAGLTLSSSKKRANQTDAQYQGGLAVLGTAAVLTATGAIYGYTATASCRAAKQARAVEAWHAAWLPPPYGVGPWGLPPRTWPPALGATPAPTPPSGAAPAAIPAPAPSPPDEEPGVTVEPTGPRQVPTPSP